jgi:thioester reductase-like protein
MASPAFDLWMSDLAMAWSAGAAAVPILRGELDDPDGLRETLARSSVSVAAMTPSYLRLFEQKDLPGLRVLMTVGEPPHRADIRHYAPRLRYFNAYGPTEDTACASLGQLDATASVTAGRPLANTSVRILDPDGARVPPRTIGQVWLGGVGVALGYLNRPDLTAASFVDTPSGRLYATGDLGRWNDRGSLEILGRSDGQVKVHGQRVELGEIEQALASDPRVRQAVAAVDTRGAGTGTVRAFVCLQPTAAEPTQAEWQDFLSPRLPSYMLPSRVIRVADIPVGVSGKVDRDALMLAACEPNAEGVAEDGDRRRTPPLGDLERSIADVWAAHLECAFVAREDSFFDLGGDSVKVIATVTHLRRTLDCTVNDLYEHPRLTDFALACRPRREHLRSLIHSAAHDWRRYRDDLAAYDAERTDALAAAQERYARRNESYRRLDVDERRPYGHVLLTGATGYVGSYVLRELLRDPHCTVSVLARGEDDRTARARLGDVLLHYFGADEGGAVLETPRLTVLASDLRRDDLGLSSRSRDRLECTVDAIFHCAANVRHYGHAWEFHADNVAATARLLALAADRRAAPSDFHFVSTLSTCGRAPEAGFRLFTEYDDTPEALDDNYYVRSKQEAERLVVAAGQVLANACIHRVGNVTFAADGGPLQRHIEENAFFRLLAAFIRLGVIPDDVHVWLSPVDIVARSVVRLAGSAALVNDTHHVEAARRDSVADFVTAVMDGVRACRFDAFLDRLEAAVDEPAMEGALTESLERFGLHHGVSPQRQARRVEIVSDRTQALLARLGCAWPPATAGQGVMLRRAAMLFSPEISTCVSTAPDARRRGVKS